MTDETKSPANDWSTTIIRKIKLTPKLTRKAKHANVAIAVTILLGTVRSNEPETLSIFDRIDARVERFCRQSYPGQSRLTLRWNRLLTYSRIPEPQAAEKAAYYNLASFCRSNGARRHALKRWSRPARTALSRGNPSDLPSVELEEIGSQPRHNEDKGQLVKRP